MKCSVCGNEQSEGMYCGSCGGLLSEDSQNGIFNEKEYSKRKRRKVYAILSFFVLIIIAFCLVYIIFNPINRIIKNLDNGNYDKTVDIYEEKIKSNDKKEEKLAEELEEYILNKKTEYIETKISYEDIIMALDTIEEMDIDELSYVIWETRDYVDALENSRESYELGCSYYDGGEYIDAIECFCNVIEADSNYESAYDKVQDATQMYVSEILTEAKTFADDYNYDDAISIINNALLYFPDNVSLIDERDKYIDEKTEYEIDNIIEEASAAYEAGDIEYAVTYLAENKEDYDSEELNNMYETYYNELLTELLTTGEFAYAFYGWEDAYNLLLDYYDIYENDSEYLEDLEYYLSMKPVKLTELSIFNSNESDSWDNLYCGSETDNLGNEYYDAIWFGAWGRDIYWYEFYLGRNYSSISGSLAFSGHPDTTCKLEIYGDDQLIYSSGVFDAKSQPVEVNVDITSVEYLKIQIVPIDFPGGLINTGMIFDSVILEK